MILAILMALSGFVFVLLSIFYYKYVDRDDLEEKNSNSSLKNTSI